MSIEGYDKLDQDTEKCFGCHEDTPMDKLCKQCSCCKNCCACSEEDKGGSPVAEGFDIDENDALADDDEDEDICDGCGELIDDCECDDDEDIDDLDDDEGLDDLDGIDDDDEECCDECGEPLSGCECDLEEEMDCPGDCEKCPSEHTCTSTEAGNCDVCGMTLGECECVAELGPDKGASHVGLEPTIGFEPDESLDGDHQSGLASAGFGTDEDYGSFGADGPFDEF
jgi:hypothetical protein